MFRKLKQVFSEAIGKLSETLSTKELSYDEFEKVFHEFEMSLIEADVAYDVVQLIKKSLADELVGNRIGRFSSSSEYVKSVFTKSLKDLLNRGIYAGDLIAEIKSAVKPYVIVFMGVNGVGKTTTIAKFAYLLRSNGLSSVVVASDTFRAGAQEQLELHSKRLGIPFIGGKYRSDPAAVAKDGVIYASKNRVDVALIDTAGRMHTDVDLMNEVRKVIKVVKPNMRILILDALTGNDAVSQATWFDSQVGVDAVILTKADADVKGGSALSIIMSLGKPIIYLGVGQNYDDLIPYNPEVILKRMLDLNT
ncbi:MAG: signal recognition particle-docking protein FtsY [Sulfolobales archaeon]|nr:signal recognition particle-docking protein FtsY [Sulfolobales archaeon]MDW7968939.1 signal recognition particle-docking protein FtsY [Sulfolobales archaeon]